jgi:hypothetical protein
MIAPLFITSATGQQYREAALALDASMAEHGWPSLLVITEEPLATRWNVTGPNDLWGGRALKAGFGAFIPQYHAGPVVWIDADCEARGPFLGLPEIREKEVMGLGWGQPYLTHQGPRQMLNSTVLVFPGTRIARSISAEWLRQLRAQGPRNTDETALFWAIYNVQTTRLPGNHEWPLENLWHDGANSRSVNGRN